MAIRCLCAGQGPRPTMVAASPSSPPTRIRLARGKCPVGVEFRGREPRAFSRRAPTAGFARRSRRASVSVPARIICGTGSDEGCTWPRVPLREPGDEIIYSRFGFSVYPIAPRAWARRRWSLLTRPCVPTSMRSWASLPRRRELHLHRQSGQSDRRLHDPGRDPRGYGLHGLPSVCATRHRLGL